MARTIYLRSKILSFQEFLTIFDEGRNLVDRHGQPYTVGRNNRSHIEIHYPNDESKPYVFMNAKRLYGLYVALMMGDEKGMSTFFNPPGIDLLLDLEVLPDHHVQE